MTHKQDIERMKENTDYQKYLEYRIEALENKVEELEAKLEVTKQLLFKQ